jgi:predicted ribosome quality control (RQC) complex YloA/Tae2 family protein
MAAMEASELEKLQAVNERLQRHIDKLKKENEELNELADHYRQQVHFLLAPVVRGEH